MARPIVYNLTDSEKEKIRKIFLETRSITLTSKLTHYKFNFIRDYLKSAGLSKYVLHTGTKYRQKSYYRQIEENPSPGQFNQPKIKIVRIIKKPC